MLPQTYVRSKDLTTYPKLFLKGIIIARKNTREGTRKMKHFM